MLAPGVCNVPFSPALPVEAHWHPAAFRAFAWIHTVASCIAAERRNARLESTITREPLLVVVSSARDAPNLMAWSLRLALAVGLVRLGIGPEIGTLMKGEMRVMGDLRGTSERWPLRPVGDVR